MTDPETRVYQLKCAPNDSIRFDTQHYIRLPNMSIEVTHSADNAKITQDHNEAQRQAKMECPKGPESFPTNPLPTIREIQNRIAIQDVEVLHHKGQTYGDSWKKRGGIDS